MRSSLFILLSAWQGFWVEGNRGYKSVGKGAIPSFGHAVQLEVPPFGRQRVGSERTKNKKQRCIGRNMQVEVADAVRQQPRAPNQSRRGTTAAERPIGGAYVAQTHCV